VSVVLQISDPHFGTEQPSVLEALLQLARAQAPDLVILSGDITQRARRSQFDAAQRFLERLAAPAQLVLPGNHDIPLFNLAARLFAPYANHRRAFGPELEPHYESAELLVLGVNTTSPARHIDGAVSSAQIERVALRLRRAARTQLRIVVTHHPLHVTLPDDEKNLLRGHAAAARAWARAGADLVLGGHIHLPYVRPLRERCADLQRAVWAVQAGTAMSWRVRPGAPNSINLIRYAGADSARCCVVERWDFDADRHCFGLADSTRIGLDDNR
jgi:3',5'-cyclic AMP phosphodiesterase CpdA